MRAGQSRGQEIARKREPAHTTSPPIKAASPFHARDLAGLPPPYQPIHAVSDRENRKACARDWSGGSTDMTRLLVPRRVLAISVTIASRCRWRGHRQSQGKYCCGKNAPGDFHGSTPLIGPTRD